MERQSQIINSSSSGAVFGDRLTGGLVGDNYGPTSEVKNCFSTANVSYVGFMGIEGQAGLIGHNEGLVSNCYSIGDVPNVPKSYNGVVVGGIHRSHSVITNTYGLANGDLPLIGDAYGTSSDISFFNDICELETRISISTTSYTDLLSVLNAWVDANNADGLYHYWTADTANENGGFPVFVPQPISAKEIENAQVIVLPTQNSALIEWLAVEEAITYTIEIKKGETLVCLLVFDGDGYLVSENYTAAPSRKKQGHSAKRASVIVNGWQYVVNGLEPDTEYIYTIIAKKNDDSVVYNETISFETLTDKKYFIITFINWDGTVLQSSQVEENTTPIYTGATPTHTEDAQYTYIFAGWTPEVVPVYQDATYTATYSSTIRKYTITFLNDDNSVLCADEWEYGSIPTCEGPTKPEDEQYTYNFTGWVPEVVAVNGDATYTATYIAIPKSEGIDVLRWDSSNPKKIIHDGHLYILRGGKVYNIQGVRVE